MGMFGNDNNGYEEKSSGSSVFSKIANSETKEGGVYILPGIYPVLMVDVIKVIKTRKGDDMFIAELEIIQSQVEDRPAGTKVSLTHNLRHDVSPQLVKTFFAKMMGVTDEEIDAEGLKFACSEKQPCKGRLVRLEATRKEGKDYLVHTWTELPEAMQEKAKELRAEAGFAPF
jgi:hypothetical protein